MVWIQDIWFYFLQSEETAYVDIYNGSIYHEFSEDTVEIPKPFTKLMMLRDYTSTFADSVKYGDGKKLVRYFAGLNDEEMRQEFHHRMYSEQDNISDSLYWSFFPYAKERLFDYAEEWCIANNLKFTRKDTRAKYSLDNAFGHLSI